MEMKPKFSQYDLNYLVGSTFRYRYSGDKTQVIGVDNFDIEEDGSPLWETNEARVHTGHGIFVISLFRKLYKQ